MFFKFCKRGLNFKIILNPADTDIFGRLQALLKRSRRLATNQTSSRRLAEDVWFKTSLRRPVYVVLKTSVYDVLKTSDLRRLEDVWFTTSWRRFMYIVLKTSYLWRLENVWFTTSWRRLIYVVLKTSDLLRLEDVWFTTSWKSLIYDVLKTSVKRRLCSNVVATSIQRRKRWFFLIIFRKF